MGASIRATIAGREPAARLVPAEGEEALAHPEGAEPPPEIAAKPAPRAAAAPPRKGRAATCRRAAARSAGSCGDRARRTRRAPPRRPRRRAARSPGRARRSAPRRHAHARRRSPRSRRPRGRASPRARRDDVAAAVASSTGMQSATITAQTTCRTRVQRCIGARAMPPAPRSRRSHRCHAPASATPAPPGGDAADAAVCATAARIVARCLAQVERRVRPRLTPPARVVTSARTVGGAGQSGTIQSACCSVIAAVGRRARSCPRAGRTATPCARPSRMDQLEPRRVQRLAREAASARPGLRPLSGARWRVPSVTP